MPFKLQSKGRRHIPRQRHRVTNWREYDASLRNRGSVTIWFTPEAIAGWKAQPRTTPGGQRHYSDLAIETALTLRTVFRLALRQSEGLIGSIMKMLEIDLPVPDHTTLSRRACGLPVCTLARIGTGELHLIVDSTGLKLRGAGEWLFEKHGTTNDHRVGNIAVMGSLWPPPSTRFITGCFSKVFGGECGMGGLSVFSGAFSRQATSTVACLRLPAKVFRKAACLRPERKR